MKERIENSNVLDKAKEKAVQAAQKTKAVAQKAQTQVSYN